MTLTRFDQLTKEQLQERLCAPWTTKSLERSFSREFYDKPDPDGKQIYLIPGRDYKNIAPGTVLFSIFGERKVMGTDSVDDDTRGGYLAYGVIPSQEIAASAPERGKREIQLDT